MATAYDATIKDLQEAAMSAGWNYEIWWVFRGADTRPRYLDVLNRYWGYFSVAGSAHFISMIVALYRIYETRSDTHNLPTLIDRLESDAALPAEEIARLRDRYASLKPLWVKVSILRNEVFGHRALTVEVEKAFVKAGVSPSQFVDLVEGTKALLNDLTEALTGNTHAFNLSSTRDTIRLLEDLKSRDEAL